MIKKAGAFIIASFISFIFIAAIPLLHALYSNVNEKSKTKGIAPKQVELFNRNRKKKKKIKVIKQIKPKKLARAKRQTKSRFQIDLSVSGPSDAAVIDKTELKVEAYEIGQTDTPPILKRQIRPKMPVRAMEDEVEGKAVVRFLVDEQGKVLQARIAEEDPMGYGFGAKAIEAVRQYKFEPAKLRGIPVKIWVTQEIEFTFDE